MKRTLRGLVRNAIELDFNLYRVDVPLAGVNGAHLSVIDMRPEGIEHTMMFVHGYAGCAETWEYQINYFVRSHRVIAPDLRGHGQSDAPYSDYTMDELVADLHNVVESLNFPEKFTLVGHSFGGSVCVEYANAHPERLEKLVLIASAGEYPLPKIATWFFRLPNAIYRPFWRYRPRWNAELHVVKRMMLNNLRKWRGWHKLRNIQTDTLVITGQRDNFFPRSVFTDVAKMIPNCEEIDVGAAKHKVQLEREGAVNRAIERFVDEGKQRSSWREQRLRSSIEERRPWLHNYSKGCPHTIPIPQRPVHKFLESTADWLPKRTALIFDSYQLSYEQLERRVNRFAHSLLGFGLQRGDRVLLVLPNSPEFVITYYATLKIGAVVVLPNPDADDSQIGHVVEQTHPKVIVTLLQYEALVSNLGLGINVIFANINHENLSLERKKAVARVGALMDVLIDDAKQSEMPPQIDVKPEHLAVIGFTSGTTDEPKGVCLTHANLVANTMQIRHWVPDLKYGGETFITVLPLMHSYGMTSAMNVPIAIGATMVLLPHFELEEVLETIRKRKPTIFPGVPSMYTAINHAPNVRSYGLSSIKACISGAAPLPIEVQEEFEKLTRGRLVEGYGLTECSPITHANPLYGVRKVGSIGVPIPNTDARIVDLLTGEELPQGQIGELVVRGPQVMQGYWGDDFADEPESTMRDGWLFTGDVAVMDSEGYFQIISRKRDTIMAGEYSVYPRDVEEVLYENSKVMEVAVVGIGSAEEGQKVKAFVVPRPGTNLSKDELVELCQRRLEAYEVPWEIEFRQELPKSFVGKVLRRLLVETRD